MRVLLLFERNFSVSPVFMTQPIFKLLLVSHIQMLLLVQRIFSEVPALILSYSIVDHLYRCLSCFSGIFQQVQDSAYNLTFKLSFISDCLLFTIYQQYTIILVSIYLCFIIIKLIIKKAKQFGHTVFYENFLPTTYT